MATWTYYVNVASSGTYLKNGTTLSATITRTDPAYWVDTSMYQITGGCTVASTMALNTYSSSLSLNFGGLFSIGPLAKNSDVHSISVTGNNLSSTILNIGTAGQAITITASCSGSGNAGLAKSGLGFTVQVEVAMQFNASTFTCPDTIEFGVSDMMYLSNASLNLMSHIVSWKVGDEYSYTGSLTAGTAAAEFVVPLEWMKAIPKAVTASCTVTLMTYYGSTYIGQTTKTVTVNVPAKYKPEITGFTVEIYNDTSKDSFATTNGIYLQNLCGALFEVKAYGSDYGGEVASYTFSTTAPDAGEANENRYTIKQFTASGTYTCTATVTDTRGRTATESMSLTVTPYTVPVITSCSASRCTELGSGSEDGAYAMIRCAGSVSPITVAGESKNTMTISSYYYAETTGTPAYNLLLEDMTNDQSYIAGGTLASSMTYYVRFVITDALGGTTHEDKLVTTAAYAMHVKNGGLGVAFGKTSEIANAVEINHGWDLYYRGMLMPPIVYSESEAPSNPTKGLIWLKKK